MPTYVYKFVDTGATIEVQQSFSDPTLTEYEHPTSGEPMAVRKVFQPVGVTFKGSGFFKTDNRNGATQRSGDTASTDSSTKPDAKGKDAKGSESSGSGAKGSEKSSPSTASSSSASTKSD
jgi:predicted nucleic acid-binding Zn ribbon protein